MHFNIIAAVDNNFGIGYQGLLPWPHISQDLKYFKTITLGSTIIMGRGTWESIGCKPLIGRRNIVISTTLENENIDIFPTLSDAFLNILSDTENVFIIGGQELFKEAIDYYYNMCSNIYLTHILHKFDCDRHFPILQQNKFTLKSYSQIYAENDLKFRFLTYIPYDKNIAEYNYIYLLNNIITNGKERSTRNGNTIGLFGQRLEFCLDQYFPMSTIRKVPIKWIFEELMWIIRGQTNSKILEQKGITIWKPNSSREFLDKNGLTHLPEGEIGKTYGYLMRNFDGIDQLNNAIELIKHNPHDRRIIISLWAPQFMKECALPPCLRDYQFYVCDNRLLCQALLRSSDTPVALHWNICTVALLTHLIAKTCDLIADKIIINIGDSHIYQEHIYNVQNNLIKRLARPYPQLIIKNKKNIEDYEFDDLDIIGYFPDNKPIQFTMKA